MSLKSRMLALFMLLFAVSLYTHPTQAQTNPVFVNVPSRGAVMPSIREWMLPENPTGETKVAFPMIGRYVAEHLEKARAIGASA